ncbi:enoyl-CoA hydratase-related protein [Marivirga atlantica]|jgi:methylglutaconyl-CoA hydratase|uniref:Enoyl-CoA hydratase/isomerase family protein n=1 Tax=Marivirga atlantica TaxID=1548457 RepID=A0A937A9Q3_9BACT|nr:enoyl-CoA hydratase-related protein [Marivirga atlantica]MBL0766210.1 enoyl-CoA hydratase/isomerase family protein [Marivirga atlantica]
MNFTKVKVENRIGYIILNRPDKRNALNYDFVAELKEAFTQLEANDEAKVIVLQAEGKAFCAGADLGYIQQLQKNTYEENLEDSMHLKELFRMIYTYPKVVIAQIQGHALAGGCGLATVCDFSYTVPEAKFGYTEVKIGFIPAIVKVFLLRKVGEGKAKELLLSGRLYNAEQAKDFGLVNEVVDADKLEQHVYDFAQELIQNNSGQSMQFTKQMIAEVQSKGLDEGLQYAAEQNAMARNSEDCKKGIAAFLNKETPSW